MLTRKDFTAPREPDYGLLPETPYTRIPNVLCYEFLHSYQDHLFVTFAYQYDLDMRDHEVLSCLRFRGASVSRPPWMLSPAFNLLMGQVQHSLRALIVYALSNDNGEQYFGNTQVDLEHWRLILNGTKQVLCSENHYREL